MDYREEVAKRYHELQDALDEYIAAEKRATREFVEAEHTEQPEPGKVRFFDGEPYAVNWEVQPVEVPQGTYSVPEETLGIYSPDHDVSLMIIGEISSLPEGAFYSMITELADAYDALER